MGASKAQGAGKDGHRSELQRRLDAGSSAYALLRALSALRNPAFPGPLGLSRSEPLHMSPHPLFPCLSPAAWLAWAERTLLDEEIEISGLVDCGNQPGQGFFLRLIIWFDDGGDGFDFDCHAVVEFSDLHGASGRRVNGEVLFVGFVELVELVDV